MNCSDNLEVSKCKEGQSSTTKKDSDQRKESAEDFEMFSTMFALSPAERDQRYRWIYDSGETNHICNSRDPFEISYHQLA